jgi:hypothetical protein
VKRLALVLVAVALGSAAAPAFADGPSSPIPSLHTRYVCVMTDEHPPQQGICVWVPLPYSAQR